MTYTFLITKLQLKSPQTKRLNFCKTKCNQKSIAFQSLSVQYLLENSQFSEVNSLSTSGEIKKLYWCTVTELFQPRT